MASLGAVTAAAMVLGFILGLMRVDAAPRPNCSEVGLESAAKAVPGVVFASVWSPRVGVVVVDVWGGRHRDVKAAVERHRPAGLLPYQVRVHRVTIRALAAAVSEWSHRVTVAGRRLRRAC